MGSFKLSWLRDVGRAAGEFFQSCQIEIRDAFAFSSPAPCTLFLPVGLGPTHLLRANAPDHACSSLGAPVAAQEATIAHLKRGDDAWDEHAAARAAPPAMSLFNLGKRGKTLTAQHQRMMACSSGACSLRSPAWPPAAQGLTILRE